jgi:predicted ester cyclase
MVWFLAAGRGAAGWSGAVAGDGLDLGGEQQLAVDAHAVEGAAQLQRYQGLAAMIAQIRGAFPDLTFTTEVGPLRDGDFLIGRWRADGHYAGGFPGATAAAGTPVAFTGTDILRLRDGRLAEYWLNGDTLDLLRQLAHRRGPAGGSQATRCVSDSAAAAPCE